MFRIYMNEAGDGSEGEGGSGIAPSHGGAVAPESVSQPTNAGVTNQPSASPWPDNWREIYASGDEKKLNQLSRYASPAAALDGLIATKQKISSGEYKSSAPFPDKGSPEEQLEWRKNNGVPEAADKYSFTHKIPDEDADFIKNFSNFSHSKNIPQAYANEFLGYLYSLENQMLNDSSEELANYRQEQSDKLHVEWGNNYRRNMNVIGGFLGTAPQSVQEKLKSATTPEGMPVLGDAEVLKFLAGKALEINPMPTLVSSGGDTTKGINDRIAEIDKMMRNNSREYYKNESIQAEYRDLLRAKDRMSKVS